MIGSDALGSGFASKAGMGAPASSPPFPTGIRAGPSYAAEANWRFPLFIAAISPYVPPRSENVSDSDPHDIKAKCEPRMSNGEISDPPQRAASRRGGTLYFVASMVAQVSALLRYVSLARLLGPEQLGLAATLVVTAAFFDLISDTGSDKFLVQDRHGDDPRVQKLVQTVFVGRGVTIALLLVVFAVPISWLYKDHRLVVGLMFLSLSPLIIGFTHLDNRRAQRDHDFTSESICTIAGESASLIVTIIAAWLTRNYTAILYGLVTRALVIVAISHLRSHRAYALGWVKEHYVRLATFSGPLMLNGVMLFVGSQADRVLVGNQLGVKALGIYSAVMLLVYYPTAMVNRFMMGFYLPQAAATRDDPMARERVSEGIGGQVILLAITIALGFAAVGPLTITILYGNRYSQTILLVSLIGILQTTRLLIAWPTSVSLGLGSSSTVLISNVMRLCVLPGAFVGLWLFGGLEGVVAGFIAGEMVAIITALCLFNRLLDRPLFSGFDRLGSYLATCAAIVAFDVAIEMRSMVLGGVALAAGAGVVFWLLRREAPTIALAGRLIAHQARNALTRLGRAPALDRN